MTADEAIFKVDVVRPNQYTTQQKLDWLNDLDGKVFNEVILTHKVRPSSPEEEPAEQTYTEHTSGSDELLIPSPYAGDVYMFYLISQIDLYNGEVSRYNQSITLFNTAYTAYQDWYNRGNLPISKGRFLF